MTQRIPRASWRDQLDDFTDRNAGRRAILEVDDPEIGAQPVVDYPLWGITYDPVTDRVEVMFGDFRDLTSHLTHGVRGVRSIELLREVRGDELLRLVEASGRQTRLRLVSPVAEPTAGL